MSASVLVGGPTLPTVYDLINQSGYDHGGKSEHTYVHDAPMLQNTHVALDCQLLEYSGQKYTGVLLLDKRAAGRRRPAYDDMTEGWNGRGGLISSAAVRPRVVGIDGGQH